MDLDIAMKKRVLTTDEAKGVVYGIPALRNMFDRFPDYKGDLFGDNDNSNGILYLSRLNTNEHRPAKSDIYDEDGENDITLIESKEEAKIGNVITMSTSTRDKKRQFAMSLSTLAAKPHKRHTIVEEGAVTSLIDLSLIDDIPIRR